MILLGGIRCEVPGAPDTKNPLDHPGIPWMTDGDERHSLPIAIVLHTTKGRRGELVEEPSPPSERAERYARYQAGTKRDVSWDFTVDVDGTIVQSNDPSGPCGGRKVPWYSWHAGHANGWTLGIEVVQTEARHVYTAQLQVMVALVRHLCGHYGIPLRIPVDGAGKPWSAPIFEVVSTKRGGRQRRWSGILGHCNVTTPDSRGPGDPGDHVRAALLAAGFEGYDVTGIAREKLL